MMDVEDWMSISYQEMGLIQIHLTHQNRELKFKLLSKNGNGYGWFQWGEHGDLTYFHPTQQNRFNGI